MNKIMSKDELEKLVHEISINILKTNINDFTQEMSEAVKKSENYDAAIVNALALVMTQTQKYCEKTIIDTLYEILYKE